MTAPMPSVTFYTLGDYKAGGMRIWAHCLAPNAGHGGEMDLDLLIRKYRANHVVVGDDRIAAAARCSRCQHQGARLTVSPGHPTADVGARRAEGGAN